MKEAKLIDFLKKENSKYPLYCDFLDGYLKIQKVNIFEYSTLYTILDDFSNSKLEYSKVQTNKLLDIINNNIFTINDYSVDITENQLLNILSSYNKSIELFNILSIMINLTSIKDEEESIKYIKNINNKEVI